MVSLRMVVWLAKKKPLFRQAASFEKPPAALLVEGLYHRAKKSEKGKGGWLLGALSLLAMNLLGLPGELLSVVVSYLPTNSWYNVGLVCRTLHRAVWSQRMVRLPPNTAGLLNHLLHFNLLGTICGARALGAEGVALLPMMSAVHRLHILSR